MTRSVPLLKCLRVGRHVVVLLVLVAVASLGLSCQPKPKITTLPWRGKWLDQEERSRSIATLRNIPGVFEVKFDSSHFSVYTTQPEDVPGSIEGVPVHTFSPAVAALRDIPGVVAVEESRALIFVYTTQPANVPPSIEGIPVRTGPPPRLLQR